MTNLASPYNKEICYFTKTSDTFLRKSDFKYFDKKVRYSKKNYYKSYYKSILVGNKTLNINHNFSSLIGAINSSYYILNLTDCWDGENAEPIKNDIYFITIEYLVNLTDFIYNNFNVIIAVPEINPCKDGSLDLEWRTNENVLLINLKSSNNLDIHYYGENKITNNSIKGISKTIAINEDLCFWMKKLV